MGRRSGTIAHTYSIRWQAPTETKFHIKKKKLSPPPCSTSTRPNLEKATPPPPGPCGVTTVVGVLYINKSHCSWDLLKLMKGPPHHFACFNVGCSYPQHWLQMRPTSIIASLSVPPRQTNVVLARTIKIEQYCTPLSVSMVYTDR